VFPSETVEILYPRHVRVPTVNGQRLKPGVTNGIEPSLIESIYLVDPVYYD